MLLKNAKHLIPAALLLLIAFASPGQVKPPPESLSVGGNSSLISGKVISEAGIPVISATVALNGSKDATQTDSLGNFRFATAAKGKKILSVSSVGFKTHKEQLQLADSPIHLLIMLEEALDSLEEVVVSAGSFSAGDRAKGAALTAMDAMTVAGTGGDLANGIRALPGAQQIGEQAGLFVRGGSGEEAKYFMDGMLLNKPNYSSVPGIMQPARFSAFLFKGILFSSGGYSALYGQAMSSALILESVDLPEESSASFSAFLPGHLNGGFQKLAANKKSSYGIGAQYSNMSLYNEIIPQKPDYYKDPEYLNADANYRVKTSETGMLKLYANVAASNIGMKNPDVDSTDLKSGFGLKGRNVYTNISYRESLNDDWKIELGTVYSYSRDDIQNRLYNSDDEPLVIPEEPFRAKNSHRLTGSHFAQGRAVLTHYLPGGQAIRFGGEHFYSRDRFHFNDTLSVLSDHLTAAFVEGDIYINGHIAAKLGARLEHSSLLDKASIAPRISLAYRIKEGEQVNLAYGLFYQKPENRLLRYRTSLDYSRATHYVLNYTKRAGNRFFRAEAYYKQYRDLVKTEPSVNNQGRGYARGIELFLRDKRSIRNVDYWFTYTFLDTKREYMNYPVSLEPTFAAPHTATLAVKTFIPGISTNINASYSFAAGRPYYDIRTLHERNNPEIFDQGHTASYSVLNLHVAHLTSFFKNWKNKDFSGIAFGVNNLLGTRQVFGYNYSYDGTNKMPITLPARRTFFIGIFMSFGVDRTDDFMDENL